jgi:hypothetical protein
MLHLSGMLVSIVLAFNKKTITGVIINWAMLKGDLQDLWPKNLVKAKKDAELHINIVTDLFKASLGDRPLGAF